LSVSATASQDGLFVTVVNNNLSTGFDARLQLPPGFASTAITAERLTAPDIRAENTAENPAAVSPTPVQVGMSEMGQCHLTFPAQSVTAVQFRGEWALPLANRDSVADQEALDRQMQEQSEFEVKV
jgi:alpha-L-arabinofuranosidase